MRNSGLIGIHRSNAGILDEAYQLMEVIFPDVQAHTIENFVLGEVCRLKALQTLSPARHHLGNWSSIGKKDYNIFGRKCGERFRAQLVPREGLEPSSPHGQRILNPSCLPVPPPWHWADNDRETRSLAGREICQ